MPIPMNPSLGLPRLCGPGPWFAGFAIPDRARGRNRRPVGLSRGLHWPKFQDRRLPPSGPCKSRRPERLANHSTGGESPKISRTPGPFVSLLGCDLKFPSSNQRATYRVRVETSADNLTDLRAGLQVHESMKTSTIDSAGMENNSASHGT